MLPPGQDHEGLYCVCPKPECWATAEVRRTWAALSSPGGQVILAATWCPQGHHYQGMELDSLHLLWEEADKDIARLQYGEDKP